MPKKIPSASGRRSRDPWGTDRINARRTFLIVCEGTKTEPLYFEGFRGPRVVISVEGTGKNTLTLVDEAVQIRQRLMKAQTVEECWCVFDRDSFPVDHFNNAVNKAEANGFNVAFSNQAFELWYLLHFDYCDSALYRSSYWERLSAKLGRKYEKSDQTSRSMYDRLHSLIPVAIANAKRLHANYAHETPEQRDPCTTVHLLVERLLENTAR